MDKVATFYDDFSKAQIEKGINHRHLSIQKWLEHFGLKPDSQVLELGCGVGTVSELIIQYLGKEGRLISTDISDLSLDAARDRLRKYSNISVQNIDFTNQKLDGQTFNFIVLPDVLEHIPIKTHKVLFDNLSSMLEDDGLIIIHIPNPNHLEWTIENNPQELQIIDQPIHTRILANNLQHSNLYIHFLSSYSIYNKESDYQILVLRRIPENASYMPKEKFLNDSMKRKFLRKLRSLARSFGK